jgi:lipopolysaccharide heptosyltransferase I
MPGRSRLPLAQYPAQRVALLKPSSLGDVVHSLPVLTALRHRYPRAHLTWIINRSYAPLVAGHPHLDATLEFDRSAARSGWRSAARTWGRFLRDLRHSAFDLVIDLQGLFRSGLLAALSGAGRRVGLGSAREGAPWFYTDVVPVANFQALHAVDRYWLVAEALGVGDLPREFLVPIPAEAQAWAGATLAGFPRPWLMVAAGSRWRTKRWPPEHFAVLLGRAQADFGGTAVFVGSAEDSPLAVAIAGRLEGPAVDLTDRTTLPQLAAVLRAADVMIANDTGPLHLAAALGRPVVAPYTCTRVQLTGPYGGEHGTVETRVWCQGSYLKRCARMDCMDELVPDRLWPRLHEVLLSWQRQPRPA